MPTKPSEDTPARPKLKIGLRPVIILVVTLVVVVLVVDRLAGGQEVWVTLRTGNTTWIAAATVMAIVQVMLGVLRWQLMLATMGYRVSFWQGLNATLATYPLVVVTPSRANEFLRAYAVRDTVPIVASTSSTLGEKVIDLLGLLLVAAIGAASHGLWVWAGAMLLLAALEVAVVAAIMRARHWVKSLPFFKRRSAKVEQLFEAFVAMKERPLRTLGVTAVSLTIRLGVVVIGYALLRAFGSEVTLGQTFATWPLAVLIGLLPLTLAGMGTRDAAFVYLLKSSLGVDVAQAAVVSSTLAYSAIVFWFFAAVGIPFMLREAARSRESVASPE